MKHAIIRTILFAVFIIIAGRVYAQHVIIDYQAWNPSNPPCNLFATATDVPATINGNPGTIQHQTKIGEPVYSDNSIALSCHYNNGNTKGTKYRLSYNFKKGYRYTITVGAAEEISEIHPPYLRLDITNNGGGGNTLCNGDQSINQNLSGNPAPHQITNANYFLDYPYHFSSPLPAAYSTLEISAIPANDGAGIIKIRKITIVETPPGFTLAPASLSITCGNTAVHTFTITNESGTSATNYKWNLGASNGWLYNGSPAPQTINTTANSLNLTPACGSAQQNISATVTANGHNYNTNASVVTNTAPSLSISGMDHICSGSQSYSVSGLFCNATVTWSASPTGILSLTPSGNQVTATKIGNGNVTLTANITSSCSGNSSLQKLLHVGLPNPVIGILINGGVVDPMNLCPYTTYGTYGAFAIPHVHSSEYEWYLPPDFSNGVPNPIHTYDYVLEFQTSGATYNQEYITVQRENECGLSAPYSLQVEVTDFNCQNYFFVLSPNPANSTITIATQSQRQNKIFTKMQASDKTTSIRLVYIKEVKVYNISGKLQLQQTFSGDKTQVQMDISGLSSGIYIVKISDGKFAEQQKLVIQ